MTLQTDDHDQRPLWRPHRWWRRFAPKNIIGSFKGYGGCNCGNTWWRDGHNPGLRRGPGVCDGCFKAYKDEIVAANDSVMGEGWSASVQICGEDRIVYDGFGNIIRRDGVLEWGSRELGGGSMRELREDEE